MTMISKTELSNLIYDKLNKLSYEFPKKEYKNCTILLDLDIEKTKDDKYIIKSINKNIIMIDL